jgi:hypothetical protein
MTIFSQDNDEEYLVQVFAVLQLINQRGLNVLCRKLAILLEMLAGTLEKHQKSIGTKGLDSKEDQEARKVEIKQIQEINNCSPAVDNGSQHGIHCYWRVTIM